MKIQLTKEFIIKALEQENIELLRPNSWLHTDGSREVEDCPRCAVGSVLMRALSHARSSMIHDVAKRVTLAGFNVPDEDVTGLEDEAVRILDEEQSPMSALSYYFEGICKEIGFDEDEDDSEQIREARLLTINFVREHFPADIILDINGAKPAEDVKVVDDSP